MLYVAPRPVLRLIRCPAMAVVSTAQRDPSAAAAGDLAPEHVHGLLRDLLEGGLGVELRVTGSSMSPFIRSGDLVTLIPRDRRAIRLGDVVAFLRAGRQLVFHRVVGLGDGELLTRGDATAGSDAPVPAGEVVGLVAGQRRRGRRVRIGLGPECASIARLSRRGWLVPLLRPWRWLASRLR